MLSKEDILRRYSMREEVYSEIRAFFKERGFFEVQTPILTKYPGMEPNLDPVEADVDLVHPLRSERVGLITSPEYAMKQLMGSGMEKIFTITPVFRGKEAYGGNHLPEFVLLEWYAHGSYEDLMNETEELLKRILPNANWPRIAHKSANVDDCQEPHVDEKSFFLTEYPLNEASLAKISQNGLYAERFEAYFEGLELCNGFAELTDSIEQRKRLESEQNERNVSGKTVFPISVKFLSALDAIDKPIYGNALGIDRLIMAKYGIGDIRDIQLFPDWF